MKFLTLVSLLTLSMNSFANLNEIGAVTSAPSLTLYGSVGCTLDTGSQSPEEAGLCALMQLSGSSTSTVLALLILKEDIAQVENDAYNFMAGEEMTLALEEVMNKARMEAAELNEKSDKEIVSFLIMTLQQ